MFGYEVIQKGKIELLEERIKKLTGQTIDLRKVVEQERAEIETLKRGQIPEHVKAECETVFSHNGHSYYQFKELHEMPYGRAQHLETIQELQSLKVTEEMLNQFGDDLVKFGNASKFNEVFKIINKLADRLKLKAAPDYLLEMAAIIYIQEDEPYDSYDPVFGAKKIREWKKNPDIVNFFLLRSFREFYNVSELSPMHALFLSHQLLIQLA